MVSSPVLFLSGVGAMTLVGNPTDLGSTAAFTSIAYDSAKKTLWAGVGFDVITYDVTDPSNPVQGATFSWPVLNPAPFEGGVVFNVAGRRGYYVAAGQVRTVRHSRLPSQIIRYRV